MAQRVHLVVKIKFMVRERSKNQRTKSLPAYLLKTTGNPGIGNFESIKVRQGRRI
jgi:hypothetical protein